MAIQSALETIDTDYVLLISGDDFLGSGVEEMIGRVLSLDSQKMVINFTLELVDSSGRYMKSVEPKWTGNPRRDRKKLFVGNPGTAPGCILPWQLLRSMENWPSDGEMLIEDYWLWWALVDKASFLNAITGFVNYRQHSASVTGLSRNPQFAYSVGYCVRTAQINAHTFVEWLATLVLLARWSRNLRVSDWLSIYRGLRAEQHHGH